MLNQNLDIVIKGIRLLKENEQLPLTQKQIQKELSALGYKVSAPTISNFINYEDSAKERPQIGKQMQKMMATGIQQLIALKLSRVYNEEEKQYLFKEGVTLDPKIIKSIPSIPQPKAMLPKGIYYHIGGRRDEEDKIELMKHTQPGDVIIEMGLRLNSFSTYFLLKRDDKFKNHIEQLLQSGVHLHCLLLKHDGQFAEAYFKDRAKVLPKELAAFEQMPRILEDLKSVRKEFNKKGYKGKIKLFQYDNCPQYHALVAKDKMYITHYIYGIERRNGPVLEIHQPEQPALFEKYLTSINYIIKNAEPIS